MQFVFTAVTSLLGRQKGDKIYKMSDSGDTVEVTVLL